MRSLDSVLLVVGLIGAEGAPIAGAAATAFPLAPSRHFDLDKPQSERTLPVSIRRARLEAGPAIDDAPTAILKFDVYNEADTDVSDIVLVVSLLGPPRAIGDLYRTVLVRPFTIHVTTVLEAGLVLEYAIRMRNVSADCECLPRVAVIDARTLEVNASRDR